MAYNVVPAQPPAVPGSMIALRLVLSLVSVPIAAVEFFIGGFAIMATDSCSQGSSEFVCSDLGGMFLLSPMLGGFVLGIGCFGLAIASGIRNNRVWWALFGSFWALAFGTMFAALVTSGL